MQIEGVKLGIPSTKLIVFPRIDPETGAAFEIAFECRAVLSFADFERLVPDPKPPVKMLPGGKQEEDRDSSEFLKSLENFAALRMNFMILSALESVEGLTWDKVKKEEPSTWELWRVEMQDAGFNETEINRLHIAIMQVNSLDEDTLEEAKENFLRRRAERAEEKISP